MRDVLAERLLAEVMKWRPQDVAKERPDLQMLAACKYDEYQQFSPGMRFVESLALWLEQFESDDERRQAYEFIRSRLVFISNAEMEHFVSIAFPDFIRPLLISQAAIRLRAPERFVNRIVNSTEFRVLLRRSLFLGLSDGARIDLFRRSNTEVSHEQVWQAYEISPEKAEDMLSKLASDIEDLCDAKLSDAHCKFRTIFLLDDFAGSGLSYFRRESGSSQFDGKICRFFRLITDSHGHLNSLVDARELHICTVFYVATVRALSHLERITTEWLKDNGSSAKCTVRAIQSLPDTIRLDSETDRGILPLLKKYFDDQIVDEHFCKGRHAEPYWGFDQGGLPLVLSHNTPNNSVPLLWFEKDRKCRGLFPRVGRHRMEP